MRTVEFLDTSLRDGEQTPGANFQSRKKLPLQDSWRNGAFQPSKLVFQRLVQTHLRQFRDCKALEKTAVTGLARSVKSDIDACYEAPQGTPSIHKFTSLLQTSPIHRKYKLNKSKGKRF